MDSATDTVIVGAGPYGLSLATHLRRRRVPFRIFGAPMSFWNTMSPGMYLKSLDFATTLFAPEPGYTFIDYCRGLGVSSAEPCEIALFARYGEWFQAAQVPELEPVLVASVRQRDGGFLVTLQNGDRVAARNVVVATGLTAYERVPEVLASLPPGLASHTSANADFGAFRHRRVLVVGAGQSALQAAALLHEHGAEVEMAVRGDGIHFGSTPPARRILRHRILHPMSVLGPGRLNFFLQHAPSALHHMSDRRRLEITRRHLGPWGAWWLRHRVDGVVPVRARTAVVAARPASGGVAVTVRAGEREEDLLFDHVIYGTGFEVDVDRLPFLDRRLAAAVRRIERAPALTAHFESSVRGLYFVGPASLFSFGPLFRFVAGGAYTVPTVSRRLAVTSRALRTSRRPAVAAVPGGARP